MLKQYTGSFHSNIYLNAAAELGIPFKIIDKESGFCQLHFGTTAVTLIMNHLGVNDRASCFVSKRKDLSATVLRAVTTIGPHYISYNVNRETVRRISQQIFQSLHKEKDIVIKAPDLSLGLGVYLRPRMYKEVYRAVHALVHAHHVKTVLVEPYFAATKEYRLLIYKGVIIDVLWRRPAFVTGDGRLNIRTLISQKNQVRQQGGFKPITVDHALLKVNRYTLRSVPDEGVHVALQPMCNLAVGGEAERVPVTNLHAEYRDLAKRLHRESLLKYIGVDLMTTDPSSRPNRQTANINEYNSAPTPDVPYFADVQSGRGLVGIKRILRAVQRDLEK